MKVIRIASYQKRCENLVKRKSIEYGFPTSLHVNTKNRQHHPSPVSLNYETKVKILIPESRNAKLSRTKITITTNVVSLP